MKKTEMSAGIGRSRVVNFLVVAEGGVINIFANGKYKRFKEHVNQTLLGLSDCHAYRL
jgi:hypothetical protein